MRGRGAWIAIRVLTVVVATTIALGIAEVTVRMLALAPGFAAVPFGEYRTSDDPELLWELNPESPGVNAHGLRGAPVESPKARERIVVLGDSIAYGVELETEQTISRRLAVRLAERGRDAEVLNAGVAGYNTIQEARHLERIAPELRPDRVVLVFCLNDLDSLSGIPEGVARHANREGAAVALALTHESQRWSPAKRTLMKHSHLMRMLTTASPTITGKSGRDAAANDTQMRVVIRGFERIRAAATEGNFQVTVAVCPRFTDTQRELDRRTIAAAMRLARERGFDAIDLLPPIVTEGRRTSGTLSLPGDTLHPNAAGADLIARIIAERLTAATARGSR